PESTGSSASAWVNHVASDSPAERPVPSPSVPYLRVVRGDATPEEIASLVATLSALAAARASAPALARPRPVSAWADRSRRLRPVRGAALRRRGRRGAHGRPVGVQPPARGLLRSR